MVSQKKSWQGKHEGSEKLPFFIYLKFIDMELRIAERKQAKIKLGLQGPSGSGKTYSALLLAYGLCNDWSKIAVIDTENHSADLYAHLGRYNVLNLSEPFSPENYIKAIEACEKAGMQVIIIDSISQEWEGAGGIIETHGKMLGNSFQNWGKVKPLHNAFIQKMLQSNSHIIATIRSKIEFVLTDKNGKLVPERVGMKGITAENIEYEFTVLFDLDIKHQAKASKDRSGQWMDALPFIIKPETGKKILNWCLLGSNSLEKVKEEISQAKDAQALRQILIKYPEYRKEIEPLCISAKNAIELLEAINVNDVIK